MPLSVRRVMCEEFGQAMRDRAQNLVEILICEGHPRRLAEWEIRGVIDATSPETMGWYFDQMRTETQHGDRRVVQPLSGSVSGPHDYPALIRRGPGTAKNHLGASRRSDDIGPQATPRMMTPG